MKRQKETYLEKESSNEGKEVAVKQYITWRLNCRKRNENRTCS